MNISRRT